MTDPTLANVLWILAAIVTLAAGIKAFIYISEKMGDSFEWAIEKRRQRHVISELASNEGWPNGATSLKESHQSLYDKGKETGLKLDALKGQVAEAKIQINDMQRGIEEVLQEFRHSRETEQGSRG